MTSKKQLLIIFTLLLFSSLIFISCKNEKPGPQPQAEQTQAQPTEKTTLEKLQGRWMSVDDPNSVIEISGNRKTEYYEDQLMQTSEFEILDKCKSGFSKPDIEGEYIDDGELCHKIDELTDTSLVLIYMDRGNTLRYKKL